MTKCKHTEQLGGKTFVCVNDEHPDSPRKHNMVAEDRA